MDRAPRGDALRPEGVGGVAAPRVGARPRRQSEEEAEVVTRRVMFAPWPATATRSMGNDATLAPRATQSRSGPAAMKPARPDRSCLWKAPPIAAPRHSPGRILAGAEAAMKSTGLALLLVACASGRQHVAEPNDGYGEIFEVRLPASPYQPLASILPQLH